MKKLKNIKVIGVMAIANKVNLLLAVTGSSDWWSAEVQKDKKGSYFKLSSYYANIEESTSRKKYYIKGELWWAVNRFEKYLEESEE